MQANTSHCDAQYELVQKFKAAGFHNFETMEGLGLPDVNGDMIPWKQLITAKDGCEIQRMRGHQNFACHCPSHNQRFQLYDKDTGETVSNVPYELKSESSQVVNGYTDEDGYTAKIHTTSPEDIMITVFQDE